MWNKIVNYYNTNSKFHSFVVAVEFALVSALSTYDGGVPTTKSAWIALGGFVAGVAWGAVKRWLVQNVATAPVELKKLQ